MKSKNKFAIKQFIFFTLALITVTLCSCEKEPDGGDPAVGIKYLNSSDLNKMRLKGAVKSIQMKIGSTISENYEFNAHGNITKLTYTCLGSASASHMKAEEQPAPRRNAFEEWITGKAAATPRMTSETISYTENYTYDAFGRLTAIYGRNGHDTILLSYGNHNAYIPFPLKFGIDDDMLQNLSRIIYKEVGNPSIRTTDVKFVPEGQDMKVYSESYIVGGSGWGDTKDTLTIRFNASKLPVFYTNNYVGIDITLSYYPDNMLKEEIQNNIYPSATYVTRTLFEPGLTYPLVKEVEVSAYENGQLTQYGKYVHFYNERKELEKAEDVRTLPEKNKSIEKYTYAYDDKGNWTRKEILYLDEAGQPVGERMRLFTRTITYYE